MLYPDQLVVPHRHDDNFAAMTNSKRVAIVATVAPQPQIALAATSIASGTSKIAILEAYDLCCEFLQEVQIGRKISNV